MKRSKTITLVLLSGALLLGCSEENMRNKYASWDDCVADYKDPSRCTATEETTSGGTRRYVYYGPWFAASRFRSTAYNPGYSSRRSVGVGVSRGGFGSFGRSSVS